ncbi:MAG: GAF domain-containing protein [Anaerolineae bacterium]|nr:GAF domain-containing protein [Anaerolineae bacterium]
MGTSYVFTRSLVPPILSMRADAEAIAGGDLDRRVVVGGQDEISALGRTFNNMAEQVSGLIESLEQRVAERTRDLEAVAQIGREAAILSDLDALLNRAINLLCERFGFYHAQVFLIDAVGEAAVLRASTGEAGRALLAQGHRLGVGSDSVIGQVTAKGETIIALDTADAAVAHQPNPLLPNTRSEMALPLRVGASIIGALDVQSVAPNAFDEDDVHVFQILADQLAIAVSNARLLQDAEARIREIDRLNRQLTRQAWTEFVDETGTGTRLGYRYDLNEVAPITSAEAGDGGGLSVPIRSRGQVIGALHVAGQVDQFGADEQAVIEAVAERVGLAVESARLFRQTETALDESRALYQGSELINAAAGLDEILLALTHSTALRRAERVTLGIFDRPWVADDDPPDWIESAAIWRGDGRPDPDAGQRYEVERFPAVRLMQYDDVLVISDVETDARLDEATRDLYGNRFGMRSLVGIPLSTGAEWTGFVLAQFAEPTTFSEAELRRMRSLIGQQAALAVQSHLRFQQVEATLSETAVLYDASQALSAATTEQEIVDAIAGYAMDAGANRVALAYMEMDSAGAPEWGQFVAARVLPGAEPIPVGERFRLSDLKFYAMAFSDPGGLLVIEDLLGDTRTDADHQKTLVQQTGNRAIVLLALRARGRWVGLIQIGWGAPQTFTERDTRIYRALRDQAAITIDGRRLLIQTQDTARREQVLREITGRVRSSLDPDVILRTAVRELGAALGRPTFIRLGSARELSEAPQPPPDGDAPPDGDGAKRAVSAGGE